MGIEYGEKVTFFKDMTNFPGRDIEAFGLVISTHCLGKTSASLLPSSGCE